jgi:N-acyl-D-amino-acid deacylase
LLQLEQAIHKMTGMSARRFGIARRGELREDYAADVVLFDPKRVRDVATFEQPQALSEGIERVWVNGAGSYRAGEGVTARAGRFVRRAVA